MLMYSVSMLLMCVLPSKFCGHRYCHVRILFLVVYMCVVCKPLSTIMSGSRGLSGVHLIVCATAVIE